MLDEDARAALMLVPQDALGGQDEAWFQFVADHLADDAGSPRSWDEFADAVKNSPEAGSFSQAVEIFTEEMAKDTSAWPSVAEQLTQESVPDLVTAYHEAMEEAVSAGDAAERAEGAGWNAVLAEGGDWSDWDGSDEGYAQWRDWLYDVAAGQSETADAMAREQLGALDDLGVSERIAGLEGLGFTISDTARAAADGTAERKPDEVWAELIGDGGDWSDWDGSEDGYTQWRDYFFAVAASRGEADEALARERFEPMEQGSLADRVAFLQQSGFTVPGGSDALAGKQQEAQATVDELVNSDIGEIIDEALAAVNFDPQMAGSIKPLLQEKLESVAESQPHLFVGAELDKLRAQLQDELKHELQVAADASQSASSSAAS